jgi:hypothetical protein
MKTLDISISIGYDTKFFHGTYFLKPVKYKNIITYI